VVERAFDAMMGVAKIGLAAIEAARRGLDRPRVSVKPEPAASPRITCEAART
jgi:hypothetical protein